MLALLLAAVGPITGCQTDSETTHSLVKARQEEWTRQIRAVGADELALRQRHAALPSVTGGPAGRMGTVQGAGAAVETRGIALRLHAEALLAGARQSLSGLELQVKQMVERIEAAAAGDPRKAEALLEGEQARLREVLRMLHEQLGTAEQEIRTLQKG